VDGAAAGLAAVKPSLFQRLGGSSGVAAVIDEAVDRHAANPALALRFQGLDLPELKSQGVSFLVAASGGPHGVASNGPVQQHAGMGFSAAELQAVVGDVAQALAEHGAGVAEVGEVLSLIRTLNRPPPRA
jgi:hemoglobin